MQRKKLSPAALSDDLLVEMIVMWGHGADAEALHVGYVDPARGFTVGDDTPHDSPHASRTPPDFIIDRAQLGCERLTVLVPPDPEAPREIAAHPLLCVPEGASVQAIDADGHWRGAAQLLVDGALCSSKSRKLPLACPLTPGTTVWLHHRDFTFVVRTTSRVQIDVTPKLEWRSQRFTAFSLAAHLVVLGLFYYSPPAAASASNDLVHLQQRYLSIALDGYELPEPPVLPPEEGSPGQAAPGERGTRGEPEAKQVRSRENRTRKGAPDEPQRSREQWMELAATSGVISVLQRSTLSGSDKLTASSALASDSYGALATLLGAQDGPSLGHGLSALGTGRGGGGPALGTIQSGALGTIGAGDGAAGRGRYGRYGGRLTERAPRVPVRLMSGDAKIVGGLSKEAIRRTIGRRINEIRFCYEQGLIARPDLQGRVSVRFVILPTGLVQRAAVESSSLGNPPVEQCVARAVERFVFDAPEGSGVVSVTYPFLLQHTGS